MPISWLLLDCCSAFCSLECRLLQYKSQSAHECSCVFPVVPASIVYFYVLIRSVKAGGMQPPASGSLPAKRKVVETEPEPVNSEVPNSTSTVSLLVSANGDFCKYKLAEESLHFRDTLMFQTRVHQ